MNNKNQHRHCTAYNHHLSFPRRATQPVPLDHTATPTTRLADREMLSQPRAPPTLFCQNRRLEQARGSGRWDFLAVQKRAIAAEGDPHDLPISCSLSMAVLSDSGLSARSTTPSLNEYVFTPSRIIRPLKLVTVLHREGLVDRQLFSTRVEAEYMHCCYCRSLNISRGFCDQFRSLPMRFGLDLRSGEHRTLRPVKLKRERLIGDRLALLRPPGCNCQPRGILFNL